MVDEGPGWNGLGDPLGRWLRPGPPRVVASVLLLVAVVLALAGSWLGVLQSGALRSGASPVLLFGLPVLTGAVTGVAVAAFVLTGSAAARVLGALTAVGSLVALLLPAVLYGAPFGVATLVYPVVAAVHVATVVALAVPLAPRGATRPPA